MTVDELSVDKMTSRHGDEANFKIPINLQFFEPLPGSISIIKKKQKLNKKLLNFPAKKVIIK
jgi:hypothetical protein